MKLAEVIAAAGSVVKIPDDIICVLKDVIAGRTECAEWYSAQALNSDSKLELENQSHRYFITILQDVLALLSAARHKAGVSDQDSKSAPKSAKKTSRQASDEQLKNLFSCLELHEPSSTPLGDKGTAENAAKVRPPLRRTFKIENEDDDLAFATWCFLQDLNDVRTYVRQTWLEYSRGDISFLVASSLTDTAFGLLRRADDSFGQSTGQSTHWLHLINYFGLTSFIRGQVLWLCPYSNPRDIQGNVNVAALLCPIAHRCIYSYFEDSRAVCKAIKTQEDPLADLDMEVGENGRYNWHAFCEMLHKLAVRIHNIAHSRACHHVVIDEFVQGLVEVHSTGKLPMWIVVAYQTYLDIYDLLGSHVTHGAAALQQTLDKNRELLEDLILIEKSASTGHATLEKRPLSSAEWQKRTPGFEASRTHRPEGVPSDATEWRGFEPKYVESASPLERHLPAHAGAVLADLKINIHHIGYNIANHGFHVLTIIHLHKALRNMGLLKTDWHDLDIVLAGFGTKQALVLKSGASHDPDIAYRHYLLALGVPATEFAFKEARKITVTSPYLTSLSDNVLDREKTWQAHGSGYSKSRTIERVLHAMTTASTEVGGDKKRTPQLQASYTPVQLLRTYHTSILADEPQLNFDYIHFTIACSRLMRSIVQYVGPSLHLQTQTDEWSHLTVAAILLRLEPSHPAITCLAEVLQMHLAEHGKEFGKQAYDQSSGRIPKHLRPSIEHDVSLLGLNRELVCTMLDYSDAKYVLSGDTLAAYHPLIKFERCSADCVGHGCEAQGAETDPGAHQHGERVLAYGSALPSIIVGKGIAAVKRDPGKYFETAEKTVGRLRAKYPGTTKWEAKRLLKDRMSDQGWSWSGWASDEEEAEWATDEDDLD